MTRMTKFIAEKILYKAVEKAGIVKQREAVKAEKYQLAEEFRIESLGGPEKAAQTEKLVKKIKEQLSHLPVGVVTSDSVARTDYEMYKMNLGGLRVNLHYSASTDERRICPAGAVFPGDHPLVIKFAELTNKESDIDGREKTLRAQVQAVVGSCTTVKKLLQVWPESKELIPAELEESRPQLPAVQTADLNQMIGLPTE